MAGYTKLFGSIVHSTVWQAPATVRVVWVTMLALADRDGMVEASVPGLARVAAVTIEECEAALKSFTDPDPYSRSPEFGGRRIEPVRGGWVLLNFAYYRDLKSNDASRAADARRQQDRRDAEAASRSVTPRHGSSDSSRSVTGNPPSAPAPAPDPNGEQKGSCSEPGGPDSPPAVLVFPCSGMPKSWPLTKTQVAAWHALYPAVDVLAEARKSLGWIQANPTKRKTARGMPAFLVRWMGKAQDRGGVSPLPRAGPAARSDGNVEALGNWLEKGTAAG